MATRYHPNFIEGANGNKLKKGSDLVIKVHEGPVYIIGQLFKRTWYGKKMIQIEQTGSRGNPERDRITLEMREPNGSPMEPGKYAVRTYAYFNGIGGKRWTDNFEIIP